ncbi:23S rRNA (uracil(1939)-C(5))-methyltransferase RlmD [Anaeromicrobium sediminis]|uniref:23S rRNA (Uracil(1939)-C(5))-methyltransferase RlmD n=1 Tax=Anaeromicrobium sediminis TaxID=1478221 RepID=A0A267MF02_9FIRM|nr:23S rRNA (uracil(1939)-C(5))-methyltransferase RlmD [Anaeromicrobium sediminis]PAB58161.1 23S rRNA (uracil(1939)-C(5))-methyltransferase RlmD [Anaeromicrobium sediminis]
MIEIRTEEIYEVHIHDLGTSGEGIGRVEGMTIFIEGCVPGDIVKAKIDTVKKNYAIGTIVEMVQESDIRKDPVCAHAHECGGCQIMHIDYEEQLKIKTKKVKDSLERIGKLENVTVHDTIGMTNPYYYRNKAQFPVGMIDSKSLIGFYKKKSHDIVNLETCHIQQKVNEKVVEVMRKYIDEKKISVYDEKKHKGFIRHILTKVGYATGEIMVVIIGNGYELMYEEEIVQDLVDNIEGLESVVLNINRNKANKILGKKCKTLYGKDTIIDYIGNLKFEISPLSFFQVNPTQTEVLYSKALEYANLSGKETVYDIYCGIGTISLFLAGKAKQVYGIEVIDAAIDDAKINAKINNIDNAAFFVGKAEEVVPKMYKDGMVADVAVVDPPRKGCDERVLDTLVKMNPERIVYVSCNPSTLARDLKYLDENGYKTVEAQPVDMFPHTTHVETVTLIEKK